MSLFDNIDEQEHNQILQQSRERFWTSYDKECKDLPNLSDSPMEITIKPEAIDISNLEEGEGFDNYRPTTLEDYAGQEEAKEQIITYIKGCKEYNEPFPHVFLSAPAGHGKTLLATIIANIIASKLVTCTGGELKSEQQFIDKIVECDGGVIFIDEANRLSKRIGFFMLPIIERFKIGNVRLKPFTVIFATTHKGDLSKDLDALIQRCDLLLDLEHYNEEQLIAILKKYQTKQYPENNIPEEIFIKIAKNCRRTPRIARILLRNYIFTEDWDKVKKVNKIVKDGITKTDVKILKYLRSFPKGIGQKTIANYLRIKPQTYEYEIEPYLIFKELIVVENRRKITTKGQQFLETINATKKM